VKKREEGRNFTGEGAEGREEGEPQITQIFAEENFEQERMKERGTGRVRVKKGREEETRIDTKKRNA
jgi:hypothetical protein